MFKFSVDDIDLTRKIWIENGGEIIKLAPDEQNRMMKQLREAGAEVLTASSRDKAMYDLLISVAEKNDK